MSRSQFYLEFAHFGWLFFSVNNILAGFWLNCISSFEITLFFLAATKQLYEWFSPSVHLSVCLSVTPFRLCSHHRIIMKFSGVITNDRSDIHAKGQGHKSKVKVTEVVTHLSRFRTVTPVWIHIWWWNDAQSLMLLKRGALLFFKVIRQISRWHGSKKRLIWPKLGVSGPQLQFDFTHGYEMMQEAWSSIEEVPYYFPRSSIKFQGGTGQKIADFDPNWAFPVTAIKSLRFALFCLAYCWSMGLCFSART